MTAFLIAALLTIMQAPAGAAGGPYLGTGYDASGASTQCATGTYPSGFAIIALGAGRPFTTNACLTHEWADASPSGTPSTPSLYFNTGYSGAYTSKITSACAAAVVNAPIPSSVTGHQKTIEQQAWEIGCSEAAYAAAQAQALGPPAMWWADVETANSWSTNTTYNQLAIDGIAFEMSVMNTSTGFGGGFYSTPAMWNKIAGSGFVSNPAAPAVWEPGSSCQSATGFNGSQVWLVQGPPSSGSSFNVDTAC